MMHTEIVTRMGVRHAVDTDSDGAGIGRLFDWQR